jgi:YggT family protein
MRLYFIYLFNLLTTFFELLLLIYVVISYFMSPYHPFRQAVDRIIDPMLNPIRRVVPPIAGLDFSPLVLWLIIRLLRTAVVSLISSI